MKRGLRLFLAGGVCLLLAAFLRFAFVGYRFSALCLCCLAAVFLFFGLMRRWNTKAAQILQVLAALVLTALLGCLIAAEVPVIRDARSDADTDADYIIVMGAAVHGTRPSLSMIERTDAALQWLMLHPNGIAVVSGGQGHGEDMTEARAMADWLTARGIGEDRVLLEDRATSSYENILFSLQIIGENGGDPVGRIALCSSEYHMHRLRYIGERLGFQPVMVAGRTGHISLRLNYLLREAAAMWKCWLLGIE
ncbi:MAG: YdcF family protein [Oscillospiraceae bacterium]|nr:YdcF family protein [Oscillospiraceae bacterium]